MNYVPRKDDGSNIIRDENGVVTKVTTEFEGKKISFLFKAGQAIRETYKENVPQEHFFAMRRQALAIHLSSLKKIPIRKRSIHQNRWLEEERRRLKILEKIWCYVMPDGTLNITRMDFCPKTGTKKEIEMPYLDIETAIRAQNHILEKYFGRENLEKIGELDRLNFYRSVIQEAHTLFLDWQAVTSEDIKRVKTDLTKAQLDLQQCREQIKVTIRELLKKIGKMEDSLGRKNPGALAARSISAKTKNTTREKSIKRIAIFAASRRQTLFLEKKQIELNIAQAIFILNAMLNSSDIFFQNQRAFSRRLNQALYFLQSVWVEPFSTPAKKAHEFLLQAKKENPRRNIKNAIKLLQS